MVRVYSSRQLLRYSLNSLQVIHIISTSTQQPRRMESPWNARGMYWNAVLIPVEYWNASSGLSTGFQYLLRAINLPLLDSVLQRFDRFVPADHSYPVHLPLILVFNLFLINNGVTFSSRHIIIGFNIKILI